MLQSKKHHVYSVLGVALFLLGLTVCASYDLRINEAVYHPRFTFAIFMESFGFYPLYLPAVVWLFCERICLANKNRFRIACIFAQILIACILMAQSLHYLQKRNSEHAVLFTVMVWVILICGYSYFCLRVHRANHIVRQKLRVVFRWAIVYLVLNQGIIQIVKAIWNRTRFDDMLTLGNFEQFTPWFQPFAHGGNSFPSGHTASACGIFVFILLCDVFPRLQKYHFAICCGCWLYIGSMMVCRVIIGRHFFSDTLVACFLMSVLFFMLRNSNRYRQSCKAVR